MEVAFQHTNPAASHESTLLTVAPRNKDPRYFLIDAGASVSPHAFIGPDESLDGVFLTHAHSDHYRSLSKILSSNDETSLYTSPPTATILEQVYTEANRYQNLGDMTPISDALTPINSWHTVSDRVDVLPLPAGHTPGAAAFYFRIDDLEHNDDTVTILATGDFTTRPVAGYPGLTVPDDLNIDIMVANASTSEDFESNLSSAVETIVERALSGATTLVATSALNGIHVAYVLGQLGETLDRRLPVRLVGQAAKLYEALDYDIPLLESHTHFDHTDQVLGPGVITIAGPEAPDQGSTRRLFGVIEEDTDAVFVQLTTSSPEIIEEANCATHSFELSNHPTEQQFRSFVETHLPRHLVLKHISPDEAKILGDSFDNLFYWENDDTHVHVLYGDGGWNAPGWMSDSKANLIRQRNYQQSGPRIPVDQPIEDLPTVPWTRQSPALAAEGLDVDRLIEQFESTADEEAPYPEPATSDGGQASTPSTESDGDSSATTPERPVVDSEFQTDVIERLETIETRLEDLPIERVSPETVESGFDGIDDRFDDIESTLDELPDQISLEDKPVVSGTVLRQDGLVLFRVDSDDIASSDIELKHGQQVEFSIEQYTSEEDG